MCNHFRAEPSAVLKWAEDLGAILPQDAPPEPKLDLWPRRKARLARHAAGHLVLDAMIWGVPNTMPGKRPGTTRTSHVTNVRNLSSPFWKSMLSKPEQRCLVPFSEFAEPKIGHGREECWFHVSETPIACFAGIWRPSEVGNVFAFLTCEPNPLVKPIHPKAMPVILQPEDYQLWLTGTYDEACSLAQPFPSQLMQASKTHLITDQFASRMQN